MSKRKSVIKRISTELDIIILKKKNELNKSFDKPFSYVKISKIAGKLIEDVDFNDFFNL